MVSVTGSESVLESVSKGYSVYSMCVICSVSSKWVRIGFHLDARKILVFCVFNFSANNFTGCSVYFTSAFFTAASCHIEFIYNSAVFTFNSPIHSLEIRTNFFHSFCFSYFRNDVLNVNCFRSFGVTFLLLYQRFDQMLRLL